MTIEFQSDDDSPSNKNAEAKEDSDAVQESSTEEVPVQEQAQDSEETSETSKED